MQSSTASVMIPAAVNVFTLMPGSFIQANPAMRHIPSEGRYRKRSAIMMLLGIIQFDTGSRVKKKNKMENARIGCLFETHKAKTIAASTSSTPSHATQSRTLARGIELKE